MSPAILDRIGARLRSELIHERFVSERVLQPPGTSQRSGEEWRCDGVRQHSAAFDRAAAAGLVVESRGEI